jgi:hypothetical protein
MNYEPIMWVLITVTGVMILAFAALILRIRYVDKKGWGRMHREVEVRSNIIPKVTTWGSPNPLCDVTVFKGPSGTYQVSEDADIWAVDKIVDGLGIAYEDGESHHQTIHPRTGVDRNVGGSFKSKVNAMHAARKWADAFVPAPRPIPNRRAAIAHTKAMS